MPSPTPWIRPHIHALHPYAPGEQPSGKKLIKLNTNENPYGPSPKVLRALTHAVSDQIRLYPHPTADPLRDQLASLHDCGRENIIVGNGSDELLALATRAFVAPSDSIKKRLSPRNVIQYFTPSYSLYPVLAAIQDATTNEVPLTPSFGIPSPKELAKTNWKPKAALTFVTTPNAPSGRPYRTSELRRLCTQTTGVIILDEAYVDFAEENAMELASEFDHVLISRTFSKAYSLCFQRIGYFVGPAPLIAALHKLRDSYNVNGLAQVAAEATLNDLAYYRRNFKTVIREREKLSRSLTELGFKTTRSAANFVLVTPPRKSGAAEKWYQGLRDHGILVRWFSDSRVSQYLRITIGTPQHNQVLVKTVKQILKTSL
jgi:histidinol-phosphate aminotransferase